MHSSRVNNDWKCAENTANVNKLFKKHLKSDGLNEGMYVHSDSVMSNIVFQNLTDLKNIEV